MSAALPPNVRRRPRKGRDDRLWWEPPAAARALGFDNVELDVHRLQWSAREAQRLNREAAAAVKRGRRDAPTAAGGRTIDALIDDYMASTRWKNRLSPKTRTSYLKNFRILRDKWGSQLVTDFTKPVMWTWYQTSVEARGDYAALALIRAMSFLFSHAERIGWRAEGSNPCSKLGAEVPEGRGRTGTWAELDALIAAADRLGLPSIALAVLLSAFSGQRREDIRLALPGQFKKFVATPPRGKPQTVWLWQLVRSKRKTAGVVKVHDEAVARLEAAIAATAEDGGPLLRDERTGKPYSEDALGKRWAEVRAAAVAAGAASLGDPRLQFRDLRRTFGNLSRAAGSSVDDIADLLGNTAARSAQLRHVYMAPQLDTVSRAVDAIRRPEKPKGRKAG